MWTYVGRVYYAIGKLPEAQKAFERARSWHNQDHPAKLYLGMVLGQDGDRARGLREIEAGLREIGLTIWSGIMPMVSTGTLGCTSEKRCRKVW
ncbi:MAG: tetratricopeptide repeat protein [Candidatus Aerophobetes bacterium]